LNKDRYIGYLQVLTALGTLDLGNEALREKIQPAVGISQFEEKLVVGRLVSAALVERYWRTLKIASEVPADHILIHHFFDRKIRRADYQRQIIEPFLAMKPKEILTNPALRRARYPSRGPDEYCHLRTVPGYPAEVTGSRR
jgi:hypothetical protein